MTGDSFSFGRYNSVDDWGLMVIAYDYLLPPKRARKITIPGRSGSYDFGAKNWEERTLRMTCTLTRQVTKAEFREIIYALSKKARLRLWNEPDKYYIAELYDPAESRTTTSKRGANSSLILSPSRSRTVRRSPRRLRTGATRSRIRAPRKRRA